MDFRTVLLIGSLTKFDSINPHPFVPAPTLGGRESPKKRGSPRLLAFGSPFFSVDFSNAIWREYHLSRIHDNQVNYTSSLMIFLLSGLADSEG